MTHTQWHATKWFRPSWYVQGVGHCIAAGRDVVRVATGMGHMRPAGIHWFPPRWPTALLSIRGVAWTLWSVCQMSRLSRWTWLLLLLVMTWFISAAIRLELSMEVISRFSTNWLTQPPFFIRTQLMHSLRAPSAYDAVGHTSMPH